MKELLENVSSIDFHQNSLPAKHRQRKPALSDIDYDEDGSEIILPRLYLFPFARAGALFNQDGTLKPHRKQGGVKTPVRPGKRNSRPEIAIRDPSRDLIQDTDSFHDSQFGDIEDEEVFASLKPSNWDNGSTSDKNEQASKSLRQSNQRVIEKWLSATAGEPFSRTKGSYENHCTDKEAWACVEPHKASSVSETRDDSDNGYADDHGGSKGGNFDISFAGAFQDDKSWNVTSILSPTKQAVVDRVMEEFWSLFDNRWLRKIREHTGGQRYQSPNQTQSSKNSTGDSSSTRSQNTTGKRQLQSPNNQSEDDGDAKRQRKSPRQEQKTNQRVLDAPKFAYPFRKYDRCKYNLYSYRCCAQSHWPNISRLKSHRMAIHCERCWKIFGDSKQLKAHITVDAALICQATFGKVPDGISDEMEQKLRSRKRTYRNQTEEDRWKEIYRLLFPDFKPPRDEGPMSPDSKSLADYEAYVRRELPRLVRSSVLEVLIREMQPVEDSLLANLVNTIQDCQDQLFRSYSNRNNNEGTNVETIQALRDAEVNRHNSNHAPSDILSAAFQQPLPMQNPNLAPGALGLGSPMIHMGESQEKF
ncbi:hypothetical protein DL98DRAFT_643694 [Cadophora sp. DSE1049]|nr:hypothetical protein DL98DRAFT_643694 [Cadophora sp. DSE1049]